MANIMSLNTAQIATATQVLMNGQAGLFDFMAQQASGHVTVTDVPTKKELLNLKQPTTGFAYIVET